MAFRQAIAFFGIVSLVMLSGAMLSGCATSRLNIQSSPPQADVYINSLGSQSPKLAGQTPLLLTSSQIRQKFAGSGPIEINVRKTGYESVKTIVTDMGAGDLRVNVELPPEMTLEEVSALNDSIDLVFEGQRLARAGRWNDALFRLRKVQAQFPEIAASYEIEGGIYYLRKDYAQALDAYRNAVRLNPRNPNTMRMLEMLEQNVQAGGTN